MSEPGKVPEVPRPDTTATFPGAPTPMPASPTDATITGGAPIPAPVHAGPLTVLGHYQILEPLGRGGMGVVYKAYHPGLDRLYALKVMQASPQMPPDLFERFLREARAVAKVGKHPHIVQVHDVGQEGQNYYLAMDLVEGGSLDRTIAGKPMPGRAAADIASQIADALQVAHDAGIIHRDLKPSNILLTTDGVPQVSDFGLARDDTTDRRISIEGQVLGTLQYMSPEQAAGENAKVGPLADVYGLGATLYEMLTGRPPFPRGNQFEVWARVIETEPEPPRKVNPRVHPDLETICLKCMEKQPGRRYSSARALGEDLRRFLAGEAIQASPPSGMQRVRRALKRHRAAALATAAALLVGIAGIFSAIAWQSKQRRTAIDDAWRNARAAQASFDARVAQTPLPYREAHASALAALSLLDKALDLEPAHANARRAKFDVAMKFGDVALQQQDFGLATTMFSAAAALGIDDATASARLKAVEDARGEEERRIRRGLQDLFRQFEKKPPSDDPESGYLPDALRTVMDALALTGASRTGAEALSKACLEIVLDRGRLAETRVLAGVILAGTPTRRTDACERLATTLDSGDMVLRIVAAHALAATGEPRWGPPLRTAWERLAGKGSLSPAEKRLQIELGRALLIHGAQENLALLEDACLPDPRTEFGRDSSDYAGALNTRSAPFFEAAIARASVATRYNVLQSLDENHLAGLLGKPLSDILMFKEEPSERSLIRTESTFTLDALFAGPVFLRMIETHSSPSAWQVVRLLVGCHATPDLLRALKAPTPWCRGISAIGLGELRPDRPTRSALAELLQDSDPWVRACASVALSRNGDEAGLAALEQALRAGDGPTRQVVDCLRESSPGFETRGTARELFSMLATQLPPGPPPNAFLVYGPLGESGTAHYLHGTDWGGLPVTLAILGRVPVTMLASALRSPAANRFLEEELAGTSDPVRIQQVLRLMGLFRHPRAAEHARRFLDAPSYFVQVEALRTLITIRDPESPAALARLRERWMADPAILGRLRAEVRLKSGTAIASAAGLYQEILQPCLSQLGEVPSPDSPRELSEWLGERWLAGSAFAGLGRCGAEGVRALSEASRSSGKTAFARGWICFNVLEDPDGSRKAFEEAISQGYGAGRCHLYLGWLDLTRRRAPSDARTHFLEARQLGGAWVEEEATFWLGYTDFMSLHEPLEAEACWRDLLSYDKELPAPTAQLPAVPPRAAKDAPTGPWDDPGPRSPFLAWGVSPVASGFLGYLRAVERGEVEDGWREMMDGYAHASRPACLTPLLCEVGFTCLEGKVYRKLLDMLGESGKQDPTWPLWVAAAPALDGKPQEAVVALDRLVDREPVAAEARWLLSRVELRRDRTDAARRWVLRALELEPANPRWRRDLADLLARADDWEGAIAQGRLAAMADPWISFGSMTAEVWLRRAVTKLVADPPSGTTAVERRLTALRPLLGTELPDAASAWSGWWSQRMGSLAWDRHAGRFR